MTATRGFVMNGLSSYSNKLRAIPHIHTHIHTHTQREGEKDSKFQHRWRGEHLHAGPDIFATVRWNPGLRSGRWLSHNTIIGSRIRGLLEFDKVQIIRQIQVFELLARERCGLSCLSEAASHVP